MTIAATEAAHNATIYVFHDAGHVNWVARGYVDESVFRHMHGHDDSDRRARILADNRGRCPGADWDAKPFLWVVVPDLDQGTHSFILKPELRIDCR